MEDPVLFPFQHGHEVSPSMSVGGRQLYNRSHHEWKQPSTLIILVSRHVKRQFSTDRMSIKSDGALSIWGNLEFAHFSLEAPKTGQWWSVLKGSLLVNFSGAVSDRDWQNVTYSEKISKTSKDLDLQNKFRSFLTPACELVCELIIYKLEQLRQEELILNCHMVCCPKCAWYHSIIYHQTGMYT